MGVFTLPSLGSDMETGTLVEWLVSVGDTVHRGEVVAVIETQKGAIEIECFEEGTLHALLAQTGEELPVGAPMAIILAPGETAPDVATKPASVAGVPTPAFAPRREVEPVTAALPLTDVVPASPAARRRAQNLDIDLSTLTGSFPNGGIVLADVEAAVLGEKLPKTARPLTAIENMREVIGAAMSQSKRTIPHFYLSHTVDMQPAMDWLTTYNTDASPPERILLAALLMRASVRAAEKVKVMNGQYLDGAFRPADSVNVGVAVALRSGGLVAPALLHADQMNLAETMDSMRNLVSRARAGRLRNSEMTEGTITVSSLGETGSERMMGVIFPPQVALVCLGAPQVRPWVIDDEVKPRRVMTVTLSADHRVSDGRQASQFLAEFTAAITNPETL